MTAGFLNKCFGLANSNAKGVLILEGTAGDIADIGMTREAMQGALITVSLILGLPVLRSKHPSETARLNSLYRPPDRIDSQTAASNGTAIGRKGYATGNFIFCRDCLKSVVKGQIGCWIVLAVLRP